MDQLALYIGNIVIGLAIVIAASWAAIQFFSILYKGWQLIRDRIVDLKRSRLYKDHSAREEAKRKLLLELIDLSEHGVMRFRPCPGDESDEQKLICIFANRTAGRFLGKDADELVDLDTDQIVDLVAQGMGASEADRALSDFRSAVKSRHEVDLTIERNRNQKAEILRLFFSPLDEDMALTIIDVTDLPEHQ
jgi:hypothetical protein